MLIKNKKILVKNLKSRRFG